MGTGEPRECLRNAFPYEQLFACKLVCVARSTQVVRDYDLRDIVRRCAECQRFAVEGDRGPLLLDGCAEAARGVVDERQMGNEPRRGREIVQQRAHACWQWTDPGGPCGENR